MNIPCQLCGKSFEADASQAAFIERSKDKGMEQVMLKCPHCWMHTMFRLVPSAPEPEPRHLRCPVSMCSGWVCELPGEAGDPPLWGCGECGSSWAREESL